MLERRRNLIWVLLVISVVLATLIVLDPFASSPIVVDPPTPVDGPAATPTFTIQFAGPTETTPATQPPTHTITPHTPTSAPRLPARPPQGSKLGVHGIWSGRILEFTQVLADAGTPFQVVKAVDDLGWLKEVRRISPATVTVGRLTHEHEAAALVNDPATDLDGYAAVLMAPILSAVENDPALREAVDFWELTNEPLGGGVPAETYARLAQLTIKCMDIAEANGLKLAIFGFNAGTPEWVDLLALVKTGVFARAKAGGHILALHEGVFGDDPIDKWWNAHFVDAEGRPTTQDTGVTAPGGWIPGGPVVEGAGSLCLRFRFLYHLLERRDEVVPLFVSEFYAGGGYDPARKADVVARVAWYDAQLAAYDYVLGFAPFTLGPTPGWVHQDYTSIYEGRDGLVAYMMVR